MMGPIHLTPWDIWKKSKFALFHNYYSNHYASRIFRTFLERRPRSACLYAVMVKIFKGIYSERDLPDRPLIVPPNLERVILT